MLAGRTVVAVRCSAESRVAVQSSAIAWPSLDGPGWAG